MILILQGDRIAAVAEAYEGPQDHVPAPEGFELDRLTEYRVVGDTVALPVPGPLTLPDFIAAMDANFDATAQQKGYDNRITCALRAGYSGPFQAEGIAFAQWMDASYAAAYAILAEVQAGGREPPATVDELLQELPQFDWASLAAGATT